MKSFYHFCSPVLSKDWWLTWVGIIVGCTIMAAGFVFFINPYNIVPGGVYGTCIVLHSLFPSVLVGTFGYMLDMRENLQERTEDGGSYTNIFFQMENIENRALERDF